MSDPNFVAPSLQEAVTKNPEGIIPSQTGGMNTFKPELDEEERGVGKVIVLFILGVFVVVSIIMSARDVLGGNSDMRVLFWPGLALLLFLAVFLFHHRKNNTRKGTGKTLSTTPAAGERE